MTLNNRVYINSAFMTVGISLPSEWGIIGVNGEWARRFWKVVYRDMRNYAHIADNKNLALVNFRGFGVLKKIWKNNTVIGRIRVNKLSEFDNNEIAKKFLFTEYNPSRIL